MGLWLRDPTIEPDERVLFRAASNHLIDRSRTSGGRIVVTDRRVLYEPNWLDHLTGGKP